MRRRGLWGRGAHARGAGRGGRARGVPAGRARVGGASGEAGEPQVSPGSRHGRPRPAHPPLPPRAGGGREGAALPHRHRRDGQR